MSEPTLFGVAGPDDPMSRSDCTEDSYLPAGGRRHDHERAMRLVEALAPGTSDVKVLTILGEPASKSRPRFSRNGKTYKTRADTDAEARTGWHFRRVFRDAWTGNLALGCVFFRPNRQRIDVDNMLKHVCDAANGIAWLDDSQITAVYGAAELDADEPRTLLVVARHRSSLERGTNDVKVCEHCGKTFPRAGAAGQKRFCTKQCFNASKGRDLTAPVKCKGCATKFRRKTSEQCFCNAACFAVYQKGRPRNRKSNRSRCEDCGKQLSHNRGGRCRACWLASPNKRRIEPDGGVTS
ncbi:RusA family crossover junction endodeoxyribonuclease [Streptomyces sulphureus]|uniref:RusA family crossover junction endodeoxyribonuclease n=1 Tax=Streptomyces sulphureus TaxID=47758 RepID=UPI0009977857|nr:RusA family crossover junction endodeoxyribonuclease [Streptomyces sulphureus]